MPKTNDNPEPKPKGTWGGRRPGAGAPKGNMNGLKHGMRSRQVSELGAAVNASPRITGTLLKIGARHVRQSKSAEQTIALILAALVQRANKLTDGKLLNDESSRAFADLLDSLGLEPQ
jgi:hypothetical protein